jgi:dTDP-4-dehydrorhamnose reductase
MKVVIAGAGGQLGTELARSVPVGISTVLLRHAQCDIGDTAAVAEMMAREAPDVVINAAAYTAVDKAEAEIATAERINRDGPRNLAQTSDRHRLLHVSTDFVFDGAQSEPYSVDDPTRPLSIYGRTKRDGEVPVVALGHRGLVVRTSWVYSQSGNNFVKTMLRLMSSRPEVRVVADQIGAPTWAHGLAQALWAAVQRPQVQGLHHWQDAGTASWYDFAVAIEEEALALALLTSPVQVMPITTADYPTLAKRPAFSLLDCRSTRTQLDLMPPHWRVNLRKMLRELKESNG